MDTYKIVGVIILVILAIHLLQNSNLVTRVINGKTRLVEFEKTMCQDSCPIYKIIIYEDGTVYYNGVDNVAIRGKKELKLLPIDILELHNIIKEANFNNLLDVYDSITQDLPSTIITVYDKLYTNSYKRIVARSNIPSELQKVINYLEAKVAQLGLVK